MAMMAQPLTPAWTPLRKHDIQLRLVADTTLFGDELRPRVRFPVVPAGRRSGKTERAKRQLIKAAIHKPGNWFMAAPTRDQAKRIFWKDLKAMVPKFLVTKISESQLELHLGNGSVIVVLGMDKPERIEGTPWDGGILDEYGNMKEQAFVENVRPALSDRKGFCWLIGVPEGRNHYFHRYQQALVDDTGNWGGYTWHSADILDPEEVAAARADLDELTFRQEYEAEFINFVGQAYYPFKREVHCARMKDRYQKAGPLIVCFDFNVDPGICVVIQEMTLPVEYPVDDVVIDGRRLFGKLLSDPVSGTGIIGEVHIPRNSNTPAVCKKFIADWGDHEGDVWVYGDATGGSRGTAQTEGSDWDLVKNALYGHFGPERVKFDVPDANPTERARVNAVNSRLQSKDGTIRMMIDPNAAPRTVEDFEGVRLLEGGSGEIDKRRDPALTHLTDSVGYYIVKRFPVRPETFSSTPLRI